MNDERGKEIVRLWTIDDFLSKGLRKRLDASHALEVMGEAIEVHNRPGDPGRMHVIEHFFVRAHRDLVASVKLLIEGAEYERDNPGRG